MEVFMRLKVSKSKNSASFYVIKTVYENKKERTVTVEKLGTEAQLKEKYPDRDIYQWAKDYVAKLNRLEKEGIEPDVIAKFSPSKQIPSNVNVTFNGGYLFLQAIFYGLKLDVLCKEISKKYKFSFDLTSVLSRLIYARILDPGSKKSCYEFSDFFIEDRNFSLHHIYRALDVLFNESDFIQSFIYDNSLLLSKRNSSVLFYDCTNFFFEIEKEDDFRKYGFSKEHRPNPIVQMGLFMDGDGVPLAFSINPGNTNEQLTLKPLEKRIISDFSLSDFIVCTDAGLSSIANRKFNSFSNRFFVTTQSIKKLKGFLKDWALTVDNWKLVGSDKFFNINEIDENLFYDRTFYKERWINENGLEQRLIVTYSIKYRNYQRDVRNQQISRAVKVVDSNSKSIDKKGLNDYRRFIERTASTDCGEIAEHTTFSIDKEKIIKEEMYDGFYGVCTNLDSDIKDIIEINSRRWEIEESFRIMKSEFKTRPVFLSIPERIQAHFTTCFVSLVIYRILEKKLNKKYTCNEIIDKLKKMNFYKTKVDGYIPGYVRDNLTDDLHEAFGFRTDMEILTTKMMKKIIKKTKS